MKRNFLLTVLFLLAAAYAQARRLIENHSSDLGETK